MTDSRIHTTVMRRVRTIHALRAAAAPVGASLLVLALSLYLIGREVWVARVFANMPSAVDTGAVLRFFTYAFLHTHVSVQALLLLSIAAAVWLVREAAGVLMPRTLRLA